MKIMFGVNTLGGPRNIVLDGVFDPHTVRERRIRCSLRQITLAFCFTGYIFCFLINSNFKAKKRKTKSCTLIVIWPTSWYSYSQIDYDLSHYIRCLFR